MSTARSRAEITIEARDRASRQLQGVNRSLTQMAETATRVGRSMMLAGGAILGSLAIVGRQTMRAGVELWKLREQTDLLGKEVQTLGYAFEQEGGTLQDVNKMFRVLAQRMVQAGQGMETYTRMFDSLGISVHDAEGNIRRSVDVFYDIADAIASAKNETETLGIATELFGGRIAGNLIPLLRQGAGAIKALQKEKEELGYLTDDEIDQIKFTADQLTKLGHAYKYVGSQIGVELMPYIQKFTEYALKAVRVIRDWTGVSKTAAVGAAVWSGVILTLGGGLIFTAGKIALFATHIKKLYIPAVINAAKATAVLAMKALALYGAWEIGIKAGGFLGKVIADIGIWATRAAISIAQLGITTGEVMSKIPGMGKVGEALTRSSRAAMAAAEGNQRAFEGYKKDIEDWQIKLSPVDRIKAMVEELQSTFENTTFKMPKFDTSQFEAGADAADDYANSVDEAAKATSGLQRETIGIDQMIPALLSLGAGVRGVGTLAPMPEGKGQLSLTLLTQKAVDSLGNSVVNMASKSVQGISGAIQKTIEWRNVFDMLKDSLPSLDSGIKGMGLFAPVPGKGGPDAVQVVIQVGSINDITPELVTAQVARA